MLKDIEAKKIRSKDLIRTLPFGYVSKHSSIVKIGKIPIIIMGIASSNDSRVAVGFNVELYTLSNKIAFRYIDDLDNKAMEKELLGIKPRKRKKGGTNAQPIDAAND